MVDTRDGGTLYPTSCSRGNGKERVLRVTLTQPMSLGARLHATAARTCSRWPGRCSRSTPATRTSSSAPIPTVLPFGCGYAIPELQPGTYNVIVQAFQAGSEGIVNLTLTGIQETIREICDNGIDDDGDGVTDCADRKCVTEAICAQVRVPRRPERRPAAARRHAASRWSCRRRWPATIRRDDVRERAGRAGRRRRLPAAGDGRRHDASGRRSATTTSRSTTTRATCSPATPGQAVRVRAVERDGDRHARVHGAAARPLPPGRRRRRARERGRGGPAVLAAGRAPMP